MGLGGDKQARAQGLKRETGEVGKGRGRVQQRRRRIQMGLCHI